MSSTQEKIFLLNQLLQELKSKEGEYSIANETAVLQDIKLSIGSRVEVTYPDETTHTGRVHNLKEMVSVNRDGYKSIMNFDYDKVKNLSVTEKTLLEAKIWNLKNEISRLKRDITSSAYDFLEFNIDPKPEFTTIQIKIKILDIKRFEKYGLYKIIYTNLNEDKILNALVSSSAFDNVTSGIFQLDFILGNLVSITKISKGKLQPTNKA